MTFLTFGAADVLDRYRIDLPGFQIVDVGFILQIKIVAVDAVRAIGEIDPGRTVTVDAPTHAEVGKLFDFVHFLNRSMTGLTLHFPGTHMLYMTEINEIGQVVDLDPFYRLPRVRIGVLLGIPTRIAI